MPRVIVNGVNHKGVLYLPGDEKKLAESDLDSAAFKRLEDLGVIAGFSRRHVDPGEFGEDEEVSPLDMKLADLPAVVQKIDSIETLEALLDMDGRKSAQKIYALRIDVLERKIIRQKQEDEAIDKAEEERLKGPVVLKTTTSALPGLDTGESEE